MTKILKQGTAFTAFGGSIKLIGLKLKKMFGIDLAITGNNGKNYFKHRIEKKYNVYFMKHWSTFGEIYDAKNQQITNIVNEKQHTIINEHWRGFSHPEVFDRYGNKGVKVAEYKNNFRKNDGPRLVFAKEGEMSFTFWGVYELDHIDEASKTKVWKLVSKTFPETENKVPAEKAKPAEKKDVKKVVEKVTKKPAVEKPTKKVVKKVAKKVTKKPAVKTITKKVVKKVVEKVTKKPAVKTITKKIAKKVAEKPATVKVVKKATKKPAPKKVSKK